MGLQRIDLGGVEVKKGGNKKKIASSPKTGWLGEVQDATYTVAGTGNVGIEVVYVVTDTEAKDVDGGSFTGSRIWDTMWFGEGSLKRTKIKLDALGVDVDNMTLGTEGVDGSTEEDIQLLANDLQSGARGLPVALVVETKVAKFNGGKNKDGSVRYDANVTFVNAVS